MDHLALTITGMTCDHCVMAVRKALAALPGVTVTDVHRGFAALTYDTSLTTRAAIDAAIANAGYSVVREAPAGPTSQSAPR